MGEGEETRIYHFHLGGNRLLTSKLARALSTKNSEDFRGRKECICHQLLLFAKG